MKLRLLSLACVALCAACSSPKIAYKFDYHDYNAGRKSKEVQQEVASNPGPAPIQAESLVATESETPVVVAEGKTYEKMSKKERTAFVKEVKKEIKKIKKIVKKDNVKEVKETKAMEKDLKLGLIFMSVGFVGLLLSGAGQVFTIIGAIALIIGVVFFVKWLIRQ